MQMIRHVTGIAFALAILAAPAHAQPIIGDPARGEQAYTALCAECHRNAGRIAARVEGADPRAKAAALEIFLPGHYAEDAQARADVIAYLLNL